MTKINSIVLNINGDITEISIKQNLDIDNLDNKFVKNILKNKGIGNIERQCDWELENNIIFSIFGWSNGKSGTENKHELPPPVDEDLLFGDMLIIKTILGKVYDLSKEDYANFYELAFGGFEDLGSDDSDFSDDDEYDENDSFIVSDNEVSEDISEEELVTESEYNYSEDSEETEDSEENKDSEESEEDYEETEDSD